MRYFLGLDLGQAADPTALTILERLVMDQLEPPGGKRLHRYEGRHLHRFPLGTSYPAIVTAVKDLVEESQVRGQIALVVDYTGCGRPVVDMLSQAGLSPIPITIHGGDAVTPDGRGFRVPKRDLVGVVQVFLQSKRLGFATDLPLTQTLLREFLDFRVKIDLTTAHDSYGAWREGSHDDLVLASAIALWLAERWRAPIHVPLSSSYVSLAP